MIPELNTPICGGSLPISVESYPYVRLSTAIRLHKGAKRTLMRGLRLL